MEKVECEKTATGPQGVEESHPAGTSDVEAPPAEQVAICEAVKAEPSESGSEPNHERSSEAPDTTIEHVETTRPETVKEAEQEVTNANVASSDISEIPVTDVLEQPGDMGDSGASKWIDMVNNDKQEADSTNETINESSETLRTDMRAESGESSDGGKSEGIDQVERMKEEPPTFSGTEDSSVPGETESCPGTAPSMSENSEPVVDLVENDTKRREEETQEESADVSMRETPAGNGDEDGAATEEQEAVVDGNETENEPPTPSKETSEKAKSSTWCKYYPTRAGCRNGKNCRFLHLTWEERKAVLAQKRDKYQKTASGTTKTEDFSKGLNVETKSEKNQQLEEVRGDGGATVTEQKLEPATTQPAVDSRQCQNEANSNANTESRTQRSRPTPPTCKFFASPKGCWLKDNCPYYHPGVPQTRGNEPIGWTGNVQRSPHGSALLQTPPIPPQTAPQTNHPTFHSQQHNMSQPPGDQNPPAHPPTNNYHAPMQQNFPTPPDPPQQSRQRSPFNEPTRFSGTGPYTQQQQQQPLYGQQPQSAATQPPSQMGPTQPAFGPPQPLNRDVNRRKPCRYILSKGFCRDGDMCRFNHDVGPPPVPMGSTAPPSHYPSTFPNQQQQQEGYATHARGDYSQSQYPQSRSEPTRETTHEPADRPFQRQSSSQGRPQPSPSHQQEQRGGYCYPVPCVPDTRDTYKQGDSLRPPKSPVTTTTTTSLQSPGPSRSTQPAGQPANERNTRNTPTQPTPNPNRPAVKRPPPRFTNKPATTAAGDTTGGTSTKTPDENDPMGKRPEQWTSEDLFALQKLEVEQLKRLYGQTGFVLLSQTAPYTMGLVMMPSDPDWGFKGQLDEVKLEVTLSLNYPSTPCSILVTNRQIPDEWRRYLNQRIERYIMSNYTTWTRTTPLMVRPFLTWLDHNLGALLMDSGKEYKSYLQIESGSISFVPHSKIKVSTIPEPQSPARSSHNQETESEDEDEHSTGSDTVRASAPVGGGNRPARGGVEMSLVNLSMQRVGVLRLASLRLIVACERCKMHEDAMYHVRTSGQELVCDRPHWSASCSKCNTLLTATLQPNMMHEMDNVAGWLEFDQCSPFDVVLEDCQFWVACLECSGATLAMKGLHRGQRKEWNCVHCHARMGVYVDAVRFKRVRPAATIRAGQAAAQAPRKPKTPTLGLKIGTPLPDTGTCKHYRKSHRWLRFPCCGKVYPCDVCHKDATGGDHEVQWATRMICGFCSLEQPFNNNPCRCGGNLTGAGGGNHWEGGKGNRNKATMNRNDRQKYTNSSAKTVSRKKVGTQK